jgi:hypothetical protein
LAIIFISTKILPQFSNAFRCQMLASMIFPILFSLKIYQLMGKKSSKADEILS